MIIKSTLFDGKILFLKSLGTLSDILRLAVLCMYLYQCFTSQNGHTTSLAMPVVPPPINKMAAIKLLKMYAIDTPCKRYL